MKNPVLDDPFREPDGLLYDCEGNVITEEEWKERNRLKITKMVVGYSEKLSQNYNSFDCHHSVEVELGEEDNPDTAFKELRKIVYERVHKTVLMAMNANGNSNEK